MCISLFTLYLKSDNHLQVFAGFEHLLAASQHPHICIFSSIFPPFVCLYSLFGTSSLHPRDSSVISYKWRKKESVLFIWLIVQLWCTCSWLILCLFHHEWLQEEKLVKWRLNKAASMYNFLFPAFQKCTVFNSALQHLLTRVYFPLLAVENSCVSDFGRSVFCLPSSRLGMSKFFSRSRPHALLHSVRTCIFKWAPSLPYCLLCFLLLVLPIVVFLLSFFET